GRYEPLVVQVLGEHADAVAAHLRERTVGVAVVHEPFGERGLDRLDRRMRLTGRSPDDAQNAVAADPRAAVAERPYPVGRQVAVDRPVMVREEHEVVLRAVSLGERVAHAAIVSASASSARSTTGGRSRPATNAVTNARTTDAARTTTTGPAPPVAPP